MVVTKGGPAKGRGERKLEESLQHIDTALEIMESHPDELAEGEEDIRQDMRRRDREYKDSCLHSTPKPRKHVR